MDEWRVVGMVYSAELAQKTQKGRPRTKLISVRIPAFAYEQIEALVDFGVFSSRSDFINYAIQRALFELAAMKLPISDEDLLEMMALGPESPPTDDEVKEVLADVNKEVKTRVGFGSNRPKRRRVLRLRRAGSSTSDRNSSDD
uniref:RHH domain antitoxin VapB n=1 Tax=Thermococcus sp. IRI33 TaxID=1197733 RepID=L0BAP6_9EURY|nr:RHH domain antitoxin VapB [Thermococcus sp. IRI33]AFZ84249.1 RHH domain antitoxin VapB [Thermococcus sp. IRI33]